MPSTVTGGFHSSQLDAPGHYRGDEFHCDTAAHLADAFPVGAFDSDSGTTEAYLRLCDCSCFLIAILLWCVVCQVETVSDL